MICTICGEHFDSKWKFQKYCSKKCRSKRKRGSGSKNVRFYSIPTLCKCGCGQVIMNPDNHYRYRKFIPEHRNSNGTHPRMGFTEDDLHKELRIKKALSSVTHKITNIERELYDFLDSQNIVYKQQVQIGTTIPDAFIPELNLCIYADGEYWHTKERDKLRDERANECLKKLGYKVIRLTTSTIKHKYKLNLEPLQAYLSKLKTTK